MPPDSPWTVERAPEGWRVLYDGRPWVGAPRPTREDAEAYCRRLRDRYPHGSARLLYREEAAGENGRQRGGPWQWTIPEDAKAAKEHGRTGVIHTSRLQDAKAALRRKMDRQRLPNGIQWEIAE